MQKHDLIINKIGTETFSKDFNFHPIIICIKWVSGRLMEQWSRRTEINRWSLSYQELTSGRDNALGFSKYAWRT